MFRPAHASLLLIVGLLTLLFGCRQQKDRPPDSLFQQKNGAWHYDSSLIAEADATTFRVLSAHYAKDARRVYYGDTYRDGRDYFTTRRSRVLVVDQADPSTFTYLKGGYAKDRAHVFFEGVPFPVKDIETFELLDDGFARDRVSGYYHQVVVPDSDGSTFSALDPHHSKDRARVFYSDLEPGTGNKPPIRRSFQLKGALVDSFAVKEDGYAADAGQVYFQGKVLTRDAPSFRMLSFGYAKTGTQVFYRGERVSRADAATFETLERPTDTADARDRNATYQQGRKGAR